MTDTVLAFNCTSSNVRSQLNTTVESCEIVIFNISVFKVLDILFEPKFRDCDLVSVYVLNYSSGSQLAALIKTI